MAWKSRLQYEQLKQLGQGGFGRVILVRRFGREYAVKEVNLEAIRQQCDCDDKLSEKCVQMAIEEASNMMALQHPNIVQVFGFFTERVLQNDIYHLIMEYCDGGDLEMTIKKAIKENDDFDEQVIRSWLAQIGSALEYLHSYNVVHRDVKTQNIFLFKDKEIVKLGDFGISKSVEEASKVSQTKAGKATWTGIGTRDYLPPEQINDNQVYSFPGDVWALGVVAYRTAALKFPFDGNLGALLSKRPLPPLPPKYNVELTKLVEKLLALEANKRPTMQETMKLPFFTVRMIRDDENAMKVTVGEGVKSGREPDAEKTAQMPSKNNLHQHSQKRMMPELCEAARTGKLPEVDRLLRTGADPNAKDEDNDGWTALHYAAKNGHKDVAALLIEKGADVKLKSSSGMRPLNYAARAGHKDVTALLIEKGADVTSKNDNSGWTALHDAAKNGQKDVADLLIEKGADANSKDNNDWTVLHEAAYNGHKDLAALLIEKGADVSSKDNNGWTALHRAVRWGHKDVAALLIDEGADVSSKDNDGYTALHYAARDGYKDIVALLIGKGTDVNSKDNDGYTALHYAARDGYKDVVALLIDKEADVNSKSNDGYTALHYATSNGHKDVAGLLKSRGAR